jgi:hypothetical protein
MAIIFIKIVFDFYELPPALLEKKNENRKGFSQKVLDLWLKPFLY